VYTSLGYALWRGQGDKGWTRQQLPARSPRELAVGERYLAGVNSDGTITIWDPTSLEPVVDLYLFRDGEWLAMDTAGGYVASAGGARYLALRSDTGVSTP